MMKNITNIKEQKKRGGGGGGGGVPADGGWVVKTGRN